LFVVVELKVAREPLIPGSLFVNHSVRLLAVIPLFIGATFFTLVFFISVYFQVVKGDSATQAGLETVPLVLGVVFTSILSGQLISRKGFYWIFLFLGSIIMVVGTGLLTLLKPDSTLGMQIGLLLLTGLGIGFIIQTRLLAIQASVTPNLIAIATAVSTFATTMGGVVGVTVVGSVFTNALSANLAGVVPDQVATVIIQNPAVFREIVKNPQLQNAVLDKIGDAITSSFYAIIPFGAVLFIMILGVREYKNGVLKSSIKEVY